MQDACFGSGQADQLVYPGDYHPVDQHAPWSFGKASWINIREKMNQAYEAELATAKHDQMVCSAVAV